MSHGPFSFGIELTPDRPPRRLRQLAQRAEAIGVEAIFVSNHFDNRDPLVTLAELGRVTERPLLGPGVVNPHTIHPVRIASQLGTLAEVAPDRIVGGIGAGDGATLAKLGLSHDRPVRRVAQTVTLVRGLLAGERIDSDTDPYPVTGVNLSLPPTSPPLYVGGQGPAMLRMGAHLGDGLLVNAAHPTAYEHATSAIEEGRQRRETDADPLHVAGFVPVSVAEDPAAAAAAATPPTAFIVAGTAPAALDRLGIAPEQARTVSEALERGAHEEAYDSVTDAMRSACCVAGTPTVVTDELAQLGEYIDGIVVGSPLGPDRLAALALLEDVKARLNDRGVFAR